jgi:pimeloyl-ACP methyl ester carboxylesterase
MADVQTRTGAVRVSEQGSGPPVLLLHATLHDRRDFDPIVPALARDYRVIELDWPGHGESPAPPAPLQPSAMLFADVLEDLVRAMDLPPALLIGNSVGGFAAARLAITHPDRVSGLVLVDSGGFIPANPLIRGFCRIMGTPAFARVALPRFVRSYMKAKTQSDREIQARAIARAKTTAGIATAAALWRSFAAEEYDLRPRAGELSAPTLIIWGAKDTAIPLRAGRATLAALPGSRLEVLDTGHVVFSSEPEAFLSLVEPFMKRASHPGSHARAHDKVSRA